MNDAEIKTAIKAAKRGDTATLRELVMQDRSLLQARDQDGSTPLHCAAWKGHVETVRFLLDAGADINDHRMATGARPPYTQQRTAINAPWPSY
jgi:ankyrin repeat protein